MPTSASRAPSEGLIFAHGKPLRKVPQDDLVDALFHEIDKSIDRGRCWWTSASRPRAAWLSKIEEENAGELPRADCRDGGRRGRRGRARGRRSAADGRWREGEADHVGRGRFADGRAASRARRRASGRRPARTRAP